MQKLRAFTLIELMIAIIIIAVLTTGFALTFQRATLKATFDDQVTQITAIIEKAGSYALSNYLVNEADPAEYYYLYIRTDTITLSAVNDSEEVKKRVTAGIFNDAGDLRDLIVKSRLQGAALKREREARRKHRDNNDREHEFDQRESAEFLHACTVAL